MYMIPIPTKMPNATKNKSSTRRKTTKVKPIVDIRYQVGKYNLLEELARAASEIKFGQLARGDADEATKNVVDC